MPTSQLAQPVVAGSATCLVVDDEPGVRKFLIRMLQAQGFQCFEAASGREALRVLDRIDAPPLIVSDMRMPEMDGITFLEVVRDQYPDTSVIMLTGMNDTSTAVDCLHRGAADFLLKPISMSEFQARVTRALEKRALVLQNRFYQEHLERQVHEQATRIQELFLQGVQMLARALEAKDAYTRGHSIRVSQYAVAMASRMGFAGVSLDGIRLGGELHDIGKIGTREAVLHKPGIAHRRGIPPDHRAPAARRADAVTPGAGIAGRPAHRALTPRAAGRARAFPTVSAARRSRSRPASWPWRTPSTR